MTNKSKQILKTVLSVAAFAILIVGTYFAYNALTGARDADNLNAGDGEMNIADSAYDLALTDYDGNEVRLSDLKGKPIVLNFWASWCPPCKSEMPHFEKVYKELRDDVHFVMVNCVGSKESETVKTAKAFIEKEGYNFPVYFDMTNQSYSKYGASTIPMTFFIDSEGNIKLYSKGAISENNLRVAIESVR